MAKLKKLNRLIANLLIVSSFLAQPVFAYQPRVLGRELQISKEVYFPILKADLIEFSKLNGGQLIRQSTENAQKTVKQRLVFSFPRKINMQKFETQNYAIELSMEFLLYQNEVRLVRHFFFEDEAISPPTLADTVRYPRKMIDQIYQERDVLAQKFIAFLGQASNAKQDTLRRCYAANRHQLLAMIEQYLQQAGYSHYQTNLDEDLQNNRENLKLLFDKTLDFKVFTLLLQANAWSGSDSYQIEAPVVLTMRDARTGQQLSLSENAAEIEALSRNFYNSFSQILGTHQPCKVR